MAIEPLAPGSLFRLLAWLSPSFPVGAFSYSHGLEWLVETGVISDEDSLFRWLYDVVSEGSGRNDAIILSAAYGAAMRGDMVELESIAELAAAFCPSPERFMEATAQGAAFADAIETIWGAPRLQELRCHREGAITYSVAVGSAAADHAIPLEPTLLAYLHAFSANLISAGLRLIPLGQSSGQRITVAIEPSISSVAAQAPFVSLDDIGSGLFLTDIASMHHETQYTRLFRS